MMIKPYNNHHIVILSYMMVILVLYVLKVSSMIHPDESLYRHHIQTNMLGDKLTKRQASGYIIRFDKLYTHDEFEQVLHDHYHQTFTSSISSSSSKSKPLQVKAKYSHVFHGMHVDGHHLSKEYLESIPSISYVAHDSIKHIRSVKSWGLDRIDQAILPLDGNYQPYYTGLGVDVYVVDTGIDTNHDEFQGNDHREVKNIYNAFVSDPFHPSFNTDDHGHGTHVSGTVGGRSVGVSPDVNIYGLKILDASGSGDSSAIATALDLILSRYQQYHHPSVVSMSLGGPCESDDCSEDSLVMAVEMLSSYGIIVSVAAGNEGCNACFGSPNAAPHAINVGASDNHDHATYFSNYGECIDIYAPGWYIISSCTSQVCHNEHSYMNMSGTSMACPHVSGVIAQELQKQVSLSSSSSSSDMLDHALTCDAVMNVLKFDMIDSISRNLLLQVPKHDDAYGTCDLGLGCDDDCSGRGICLPSSSSLSSMTSSSIVSSSSMISSSVSSSYCYCDTGSYGGICQYESDPICDDGVTLSVDMTDTFGDGWTFTSYAIINISSNMIINNIYDSLCYDDTGSKQYCIDPGCYRYEVTRGYFPQEVGWSFCDVSGGAPSSMIFCVHDDASCHHICNDGMNINLSLYDDNDDGWDGAYYSIYPSPSSSSSSSQLYGGTLNDGSEETHELCLPDGCSYLLFTSYGNSPDQVTFNICEVTGSIYDVYRICIDHASSSCIITPVVVPTSNDACHDSSIDINMFNLLSLGWDDGSYMIYDDHQKTYKNGTLSSGFEETQNVCLPDGCYHFDASYPSTSSSSSMIHQTSFWSICGSRGIIPWSSSICVEKAYNLCYGASGCTYVKSYAHTSDYEYMIISHYDDDYQLYDVDDIINVHGVNEMCGMSDGCYSVDIGGGRAHDGGDNKRDTVELCGYTGTLPLSANICLSNSGRSCAISSISSSSSTDDSHIQLYLYKIDTYGDGWDHGCKYIIKQEGSNTQVASGTLSDGLYGLDKIILAKNTIYTFSFIASSSAYTEEIIWLFCGYIGSAPVGGYRFSVTDTGCVFIDAPVDDDYNGDVDYKKIYDDDFPALLDMNPTISPSSSPPPSSSQSSSPSSSPLSSPSSSSSPSSMPISIPFGSVAVYSYPTSITIKLSYSTSSIVSSMTSSLNDDMMHIILKAVELATRRVLSQSGLMVWDIIASSSSSTAKKKDKMMSSSSSKKIMSLIKKLKRDHDIKTSSSSLSSSLSSDNIQYIFASVMISLQWPSLSSSADIPRDSLSSVLSSSWTAGSYDDDIILACHTLDPDIMYTSSIIDVSVSSYDDMISSEKMDDKPPVDASYDDIPWSDTSSSSSPSSSTSLSGGIIALIVIIVASCIIIICICASSYGRKSKWLSPSSYTNLLSEMSGHGLMASSSRGRVDSNDGMIDFDDSLTPKLPHSSGKRVASIPSIFTRAGGSKAGLLAGKRQSSAIKNIPHTSSSSSYDGESVTIHFNPLQASSDDLSPTTDTSSSSYPSASAKRRIGMGMPYRLSSMTPVQLQQGDDIEDVIL